MAQPVVLLYLALWHSLYCKASGSLPHFTLKSSTLSFTVFYFTKLLCLFLGFSDHFLGHKAILIKTPSTIHNVSFLLDFSKLLIRHLCYFQPARKKTFKIRSNFDFRFSLLSSKFSPYLLHRTESFLRS